MLQGSESEVGAKNPNSSRFFFFFFFFFFFLLRRTGIVARTRGGERRQEKRQDTRFPSRWVMLGASRFVQEPVDVPTRRQTRIDPPIPDTRDRQTFLEIIFISWRGGEGKGKSALFPSSSRRRMLLFPNSRDQKISCFLSRMDFSPF